VRLSILHELAFPILASDRDMPIWRDGGFGMANMEPRLTVMQKAAKPVPVSSELLLSGAFAILLGLCLFFYFVFITHGRLDVPGIRISEVFIAIGLFASVIGLALRARDAKNR